jgi:hypothetical protein
MKLDETIKRPMTPRTIREKAFKHHAKTRGAHNRANRA